MLGDLLRLIRTEGPLQWELAFQLATSVAAGDEPDPNPDPIARIRLEELSSIAQLHVADVTGMVLGSGGSDPKLVPTTRGRMGRRSLEAWRPLLDRLATVLNTAPAPASPKPGPLGFGVPEVNGSDAPSSEGFETTGATTDEGALPPDPFLRQPDPLQSAGSENEEDTEDLDLAEMIGRWTSAMAPAMAAMQVGSVVGHLARRSLGQYDLPLPRTSSNEILVAVCNLDRFAAEWSLPIDDLRLWLCAHEMAFHAVLSRPHVAKRLEELVVAHVRFDPAGLVCLRGKDAEPWVIDRLPPFGDFAAFAQVQLREGRPAAAAPRTALDVKAVRVALRLVASSRPLRHVTLTLIPPSQLPLLRALAYVLPRATIVQTRVARIEEGMLLLCATGIDAIPLGTFFVEVHPQLFVPAGYEVAPAVSPDVLARSIGVSSGQVVLLSHEGRAIAVDESAFASLETILIEAPPWEDAAAQAISRLLDETPIDLSLAGVGTVPPRGAPPPDER